MRRTTAQIRREASKLRDQVLAELQRPCLTYYKRGIVPSGEVVSLDADGNRYDPTKPADGLHICTDKCVDLSISLVGADPDQPDFAGELARDIAYDVEHARRDGLKDWTRDSLEDSQRKAAFYKQPFPQEAVDILGGKLPPMLPPRVDEPQALPEPETLLQLEAPEVAVKAEVAAKDAVIPMVRKQRERPVPRLPAPAIIVCGACGCDPGMHMAISGRYVCRACGFEGIDHLKAAAGDWEHRKSPCADFRMMGPVEWDTCSCKRCPGFSLTKRKQ